MNTPPPNQNSKGKIFSFSTLLFLLLLCVYLQGFFQRDLWPPDEIRVAEIAREMKERNSFIPYLNGKPFLEKPFLHYYLVSLSFQAFGENPVAARIPSLFFTFLTFFLLFLMGKAFQKPHWGIWSIFFLGLFQTFLLSSWLAILDNSLTFFTLLSLYGFLRANLKQKEAS
ncbi:MAG: phospholipid carrier-dependent glycosyltransferase, partial [Planctomycetota bacterium]